ncbi:MAG: hypothetical protein RLY35_1913 [Bacteroidota bacterium]
MRKRLFTLLSLVLLTVFVQAQVVINEVNADNPGGGGPGGGTDPTEFIELFGAPNTSLDGMVLVFYNGFLFGGGANPTPDGTSYAAYDLDGYSTDAFGFFVIGGANVTNVDYVFPLASNNIQNGGDAIALYVGDATEFPTGTPATSLNLIDAIVYETNDVDAVGLITALGLDVVTPGYFSQDETAQQGGTDLTLSRIPDGGLSFDTTYVVQTLTPGTWNLPPCTGGNLMWADSSMLISGCEQSFGNLSWTAFNGTGTGITFLTDVNGNILQVISDTTVNTSSWTAGTYQMIHVGYTNNLDVNSAAVGMPVSGVLSDQCISFSNPITLELVVCEGCVGGEVLLNNQASNISVLSDGNADIFTLSNNSTSLSASYLYALTDPAGNLLEWINGDYDFNILPVGSYLVWGISYQGVVTDVNIGSPISNFAADFCSAFSSNILAVNVILPPAVVINELNADNPGGPDSAEFIELLGQPNTDLSDLVMVYYDGNTGVSYAAFDLDGYFTDELGFFVMGNAGAANVDLITTNGSLQNGADAIALYVGNAAQFPAGTQPTAVAMIDGMVYGTGDAAATNLITGLGLDLLMTGYTQLDETAQQNGIDLTISRVPDGGVAFDYLAYITQELTPGNYNIVLLGCTDSLACNYNSDATVNDGTCLVIGLGCNDNDPTTVNDMVTDACTCVGELLALGCTDPLACNYDSTATADDGSCLIIGLGCDDGDPLTLNDAVDASCTCVGTPIAMGCMDSTACNFDATAIVDNGNCWQIGGTCDDGDSTTVNDVVDANCNCAGLPNSIDESSSLLFGMYPNPAIDFLNLQLPAFNGSSIINIYDAAGKAVFTQKLTSGNNGATKVQISMANLSAGIFTLSWKSDDQNIRRIFIKE